MDKTMKEQKLREFANSVLHDPVHKDELDYLLKYLNLSEKEVLQAYVDYNMDVFAFENEIYESLAMRMVLHLHNLLPGSWHQDRQRVVLEMLQQTGAKTIVDVGFGVPTRYVREYVLKNKGVHLGLADLFDSAFTFAEALLEYLDPGWKRRIDFMKYDMDTQDFIGEYDCYIFQDSVEHTKDPTTYLTKTVKSALQYTQFVMSIPVGPIIPVHYIVWKDSEEVEAWLKKCGLEILNSEKVYINPEVDLFAEQLDEKFYNLLVRCRKLVI